MRGRKSATPCTTPSKDFSAIIDKGAPCGHRSSAAPEYICGTFVDMTRSGKTFVILGILWKVFLVVIAMHLLYLVFAFAVAAASATRIRSPF